MKTKGISLLAVVVAVAVIAVLALFFLGRKPSEQTAAPHTEEAKQAHTDKSDEEAYRRTMGKYGFQGGAELSE